MKADDFGENYADEQIAEHLESFREHLSLDVLDSVKVPRTFAMSMQEMRDEPSHRRFILEGGGEARMERIFDRLKAMTAASEGGLSQEQEQEQEEERETESANLPDDRPVIFSDIAFSRADEKAPSSMSSMTPSPDQSPEASFSRKQANTGWGTCQV